MVYRYTSKPNQAAVIELLLGASTLLSREEIRREIGSRSDVDDALNYLVSKGLVHRLRGDDDFFWPTRAATAAEEAVTADLPDHDSNP